MGFAAPVSLDTPFRPLADALWAWASSAAQALKNSSGHRDISDDFFVHGEPDVITLENDLAIEPMTGVVNRISAWLDSTGKRRRR